LAFATFLALRLRIGACSVGAYDSYPCKQHPRPSLKWGTAMTATSRVQSVQAHHARSVSAMNRQRAPHCQKILRRYPQLNTRSKTTEAQARQTRTCIRPRSTTKQSTNFTAETLKSERIRVKQKKAPAPSWLIVSYLFKTHFLHRNLHNAPTPPSHATSCMPCHHQHDQHQQSRAITSLHFSLSPAYGRRASLPPSSPSALLRFFLLPLRSFKICSCFIQRLYPEF